MAQPEQSLELFAQAAEVALLHEQGQVLQRQVEDALRFAPLGDADAHAAARPRREQVGQPRGFRGAAAETTISPGRGRRR